VRHPPRQGQRPPDPRPQPHGLPRHRWHPALRRTLRLPASRHRKSQDRKLQDHKPRKCRHRTSRARRRRTRRGQLLPPRNATRRLRWLTAMFSNSSGTFSKTDTFSDSSCVQNASVNSRRTHKPGQLGRAHKRRQICRRNASSNLTRGNSCGLNAPCSVAKTVNCGAFRHLNARNGVRKYGMPVNSAP
jgi:hypothetical protein